MSNLFFRNRRLLVLAICLILVAGLSSYHVLPRMEDPLLTARVLIVNTLLPGADAERVESLVTRNLEDGTREIEEIKRIRSTSRAGVSTIFVELRDNVHDVDTVWARVRDKVNDVANHLPTGPLVPVFREPEAKAYALIVGLVSQRESRTNYAILRRLARQLDDLLKATPGTEKVKMFGDPDEEIVVEIRPADLAALGQTVASISSQIQSSDAKVSAGQVRDREIDLLLDVETELDSLQRIGQTPIHFGPEGRFVQLADIARIEKGIVSPPNSQALVGGLDAVVLGAFVRPEVRIDRWSRHVHQTLERFQDRLPNDVGLDILFEQNLYVQSRLRQVMTNLLFGGMAVIAVILFLMGWRSALVVGSALPLSVLMVFTGMRLLGVPMHYVSVSGLILALGLLIDNAIVIVDEVQAKLTDGMSPADAVSASVRHLAVPLFGSTLTTALAFAPIALMDGPGGEFVYTVAISVILAISCSFLLAMTVVPALAALARKARLGHQSVPVRTHGAVAQPVGNPKEGILRHSWWQDGFWSPRLSAYYRRSLDWVFRRPLWGICLGVALPLVGFVQARHLQEQFFPPSDRDQFHIELELAPIASLAETLTTARLIREMVLAHEEVDRVDWFAGESAPRFFHNIDKFRKNDSSYAQAFVQLRSSDGVCELIGRLQDELDQAFPAARVLVQQLEQGPPVAAPIEIRLFGPDIRRLRVLGDEIRGILAQTPNVIHTRAGLSDVLPKLSLAVDEEQSRLAGLDHAAIAQQLNATLEGAQGGAILEETEELPVRVRLSNDDRASLERIASLDFLPIETLVRGAHPGVPFTSLAKIELQPTTAAISRYNGRRINEAQAFISAGVLPAVVLGDFQQRLESSKFTLPPGYSLEYGGEAAERDSAISNLMSNVAILLVLMLATLVLSFGSFRITSVIGVVAGLSVGLGLATLWVFGYPLGFMAILGIMGLVGVAINDAIVVMASLRADPMARRGNLVATRDVVSRATRHVVATSLTTMAGFAPLVLTGGQFWPPMAIAIAGGVGGATILAIYFVPSAHLLLVGRDNPTDSESNESNAVWPLGSKPASGHESARR